MPGGKFQIDRQLFHRYLWTRIDRNQRLIPTQRDIAKELIISYQSVSVLFTEFIQDGKVKKSGRKYFVIMDPDKYYGT